MSIKRDLINFFQDINKETSEITAAIIVCVRYQSGKSIIDVYKFQDPTKDFIDIYIDQLDLECCFVYGTIWFSDNTWAEFLIMKTIWTGGSIENYLNLMKN